jgi:hypothetical protein
MTMKNAVFWDLMLCDCCKIGRFGGMSALERATRRNIQEPAFLKANKLWKRLLAFCVSLFSTLVYILFENRMRTFVDMVY